MAGEEATSRALEAMALKLEPSPSFMLSPYQATYRVEMGENVPEGQGFEGDMNVEFFEEDGHWVYMETGRGQLALAGGSIVPLNWFYKTRESQDGTFFSFDYQTQKGKKVVCHNRGRVTFDTLSQTGVVVWEKPYESRVTINHPMMFPVGFMKKVMDGARAVPCTLSAHVFDGTAQQLLPSVSCFVSEPRRVRWFAKAGTQRHLTVWPVFQAFYREEKEGERISPTYRHQFLMTQRGLPLKTSKQVAEVPLVCVLRALHFRRPAEG